MINMNPISAGTGPAALILVGAFLITIGRATEGALCIVGGFGLSLLWSRKFR